MNGSRETREDADTAERAQIRAHERHISQIYGTRRIALLVSTIPMLMGGTMIFLGLSGSFNWAISIPLTISAKVTNASPGIGFLIGGIFMAALVAMQPPVDFTTSRARGMFEATIGGLVKLEADRRSRRSAYLVAAAAGFVTGIVVGSLGAWMIAKGL